MSKFINTKRNDAISSLVEGSKYLLNNEYYSYIDQKPSIVTYYNQNIRKSTLDEGARIAYSHLGDDSPIRYNKINNMFIYGLDKINVNLDNGDYGLESNSIEGEGILSPGDLVPYPNDYFSINYLEKEMLFKILEVSFDTVYNGANLYKIQYKLDVLNDGKIDDLVISEYEFMVNNTGTSYNTIIKSTDYKTLEKMEEIIDRLIKYYKSLFFNTRVQTFTLLHNGDYFYDPYLIEFLIRNRLLYRDDEFLYVTHQTTIPSTFSIDYDKTFFRYVEVNDKNKFTPLITSQGKLIDNHLSLLSSRLEDYFELHYKFIDNNLRGTINNFNIDLYNNIKSNKLYTVTDEFNSLYLNIIIKYFNYCDISLDDVVFIEDIDYESNIDLFYNIPIIIYILTKESEKFLLKNHNV